MKKIVLPVLIIAMLTVTAFGYTPSVFEEVNDALTLFSYSDDVSGAESQTLTELGAEIEGTNWRMRNADETPAGVIQPNNADNPAKFGINAEGDLFVDAVFDSVSTYGTKLAETIPALVFDGDISGLDKNYILTYQVKKIHNATVTTGIRFSVHNGGQNYYALIFGGNNYNYGSGKAGWQLLKSVDGKVSTLIEGGHSDYPGFAAMRGGVHEFWNVSIAVSDGTISFEATQTNNSANTFGATYTDEKPFDVKGNDCGIWLMAQNGNNNPARNASYKNIKIKDYVPYITAPEPKNVMYFDAAEGAAKDSNGIISFSDAVIIRKILAPESAELPTNIYVSNDKESWKKIAGASFDENGVWLNNKTAAAYSHIAFGTALRGDISVLAEIAQGSTIEIPLKSVATFIPKAGEVTDAKEFEWKSSRDEIATVEDGKVELLRKGDVKITATLDDVVFEFNIKVIGEIEAAMKNDTVSEYITGVKPVFDEINKQIEKKDKDGLKEIFLNTGDVKISDIVDIDAEKIAALPDDKLENFVERLMTYKEFGCESTEDVYFLADTIDSEYAVGLIDEITGADDVIAALEEQNLYLKLDLDNKYYTEYTKDSAEKLADESFESLSDLTYKFKQSYVISALDNALSPEMVKDVIEDCAEEIGYKESHYNKIKSTAFYKAVIKEKDELTTLEKLRDFIDDYTEPDDDKKGSGGGGGGGRVSGGASLNMMVDKESVEKITEEATVKPVQAVDFSDLKAEHWAYESVMALRAKGVINGYTDGSFGPDGKVTRAEFIKMLTVASGITTSDAEAEFTDVSEDDWYYGYVMRGVSAGIVNGYPDGTFRPDEYVSREEMAVMLYRAFTTSDVSVGVKAPAFADADEISDWAADAVDKLTKSGVLSGSNNMFEPGRAATRAETAKCIFALL